MTYQVIQFKIHYSLFIIHYSLFIIHYSLVLDRVFIYQRFPRLFQRLWLIIQTRHQTIRAYPIYNKCRAVFTGDETIKRSARYLAGKIIA